MRTLEVSSLAADMQFPIRLRWHGRGGQGVVTASRIAAEAALQAGLYPQSLPDFGAERSGAPIAAHTRIDQEPPVERGPITDPTTVIVLDASLLGQVNVVAGLEAGGRVLINSPVAVEDLALALQLRPDRVIAVDATAIGYRFLSRNLPNVPMLGILASTVPFAPPSTVEGALRTVLSVTLRPEIVDSNVMALRAGYEAVSSRMVASHG